MGTKTRLAEKLLCPGSLEAADQGQVYYWSSTRNEKAGYCLSSFELPWFMILREKVKVFLAFLSIRYVSALLVSTTYSKAAWALGNKSDPHWKCHYAHHCRSYKLAFGKLLDPTSKFCFLNDLIQDYGAKERKRRNAVALTLEICWVQYRKTAQPTNRALHSIPAGKGHSGVPLHHRIMKAVFSLP